jgi:hypothetical protein
MLLSNALNARLVPSTTFSELPVAIHVRSVLPNPTLLRCPALSVKQESLLQLKANINAASARQADLQMSQA